jgi:DNA-binding cell septation regulator SpoVG
MHRILPYPQKQTLDFRNKIEILSITRVADRGSLRAFLNIRLGDLIINDCRIIQETGKRAWFSLPFLTYKTQYGTTQYKSLVQILNEKRKNEISHVAIYAWENTKGEANGKRPK